MICSFVALDSNPVSKNTYVIFLFMSTLLQMSNTMSESEPPDIEQHTFLYLGLFIILHALIRLSPIVLLHGAVSSNSSSEMIDLDFSLYPLSK